MDTYKNYSLDELVKLIVEKNKKIDSQRSMLFQLKVKQVKLKTKIQAGYKIAKENVRRKGSITKLNQRIERLMETGRNKSFLMKEHAPVITNALLAYNKLKTEGFVTDNEMYLLILGYQKEHFSLSDLATFKNKWGRNNARYWKDDFKTCCEAGYFYSFKAGRKNYYFISFKGRKRLESLSECLYMAK